MSERFSDEVLKQAWLAAWVTPGEFCAEDAAAMRAVLEGYLAEQETEHPTVTCECPHTPDYPLVASDGSPR